MEVYVARQPILNIQLQTVAYELLFRSSLVNRGDVVDGDKATLSVINTVALCLQQYNLTDGKKAFINFTKNLVVGELPTLFTKESLIIELVEDIVPDKDLLDSCYRLKKLGYQFALDDFAISNASPDLVRIADIIKVDFQNSSLAERTSVIREYKRPGLMFVAEKIETLEEFKEAKQLGYKYFQGFFFAQPEIVQGKDIKVFKGSYQRLLAELAKDDPDFNTLTTIIESDVALAYKLLRIINTAGMYPVDRITSVRASLLRLGFREIRKWATLLMIIDLSTDKPEALSRQSLIRAKLCEGLSGGAGLKNKRDELFLMGLFSMLDTIMSQPMSELLSGLPIPPEVSEGLLGTENRLSPILELIKQYETGRWAYVDSYCRRLGLDGALVTEKYCEAVKWADILNLYSDN